MHNPLVVIQYLTYCTITVNVCLEGLVKGYLATAFLHNQNFIGNFEQPEDINAVLDRELLGLRECILWCKQWYPGEPSSVGVTTGYKIPALNYRSDYSISINWYLMERIVLVLCTNTIPYYYAMTHANNKLLVNYCGETNYINTKHFCGDNYVY